MNFSESADLLMVRVARISVSVNQVVNETVVSTLVVVIATVVVVVGVVVTGLGINEVVDIMTVVDFAVVLNDIVVRIRASAICTDGCCDDASSHRVVANVLNVVVLKGLIVVATSVILDIVFVVNGAFADTFVSTDVARVINCRISLIC